MIISFKCNRTEDLFNNNHVAKFSAIEKQARIKLKLLNAIQDLEDLRSPPGNRLEALKGDRSGQNSIRINNRWRICFRWHKNNAYDVEIVDYH